MFYLEELTKDHINDNIFLSENLKNFLKNYWIKENKKLWGVCVKNINGDIVALTIALPEESGPESAIITGIMISTAYKNIPLKKDMLLRLENILKREGIKKLNLNIWHTKYNKESFENMVKILKELKWHRIEKMYYSYFIKLDFKIIKKQRWYSQGSEKLLPPSFELFSWTELKQEEREFLKSIKEIMESKMYYLDPLVVENYHYKTSWGIRDKKSNKVFSWLITEAREDGGLLLKRLFTLPEYRGKSFWTAILFRKCIEMASEEFKYIWFNVVTQNKKVKKKFENLLDPIIALKADCYICEKDISYGS